MPARAEHNVKLAFSPELEEAAADQQRADGRVPDKGLGRGGQMAVRRLEGLRWRNAWPATRYPGWKGRRAGGAREWTDMDAAFADSGEESGVRAREMLWERKAADPGPGGEDDRERRASRTR